MKRLLVLACLGMIGGAASYSNASSTAPEPVPPNVTQEQARAAIDRLIVLEAARDTIESSGVVTELRDNGVTVSYDLIATDDHAATTRRFEAAPAELSDIAVGDHIHFELQRANEALTITKIDKVA